MDTKRANYRQWMSFIHTQIFLFQRHCLCALYLSIAIDHRYAGNTTGRRKFDQHEQKTIEHKRRNKRCRSKQPKKTRAHHTYTHSELLALIRNIVLLETNGWRCLVALHYSWWYPLSIPFLRLVVFCILLLVSHRVYINVLQPCVTLLVFFFSFPPTALC